MNAESSHESYAGSCVKCSFVLPQIREAASMYFEQGHVTCTECHTQNDLWDVVLGRMLSQPPLPMHLVVLGATRTLFTHVIEAGKYHEVQLTDVGIPADATVLQVGYSPQGGQGGVVFPIEWHGNVPQRRIIGNVLRLIGQPAVLGDGTVGSICPVGIWVIWIHREEEDGWPYILSAFEAFVDRQYDRMIVPAQSAVEITLMPVARALLESQASQNLVRQFTTDRLGYGDVLNIFLPFVCAQSGISKLPEKIIRSLNRLRGKRNKLVHRGTVAANVSTLDAAEGLCAAVFGVEYVRYARPKLIAWLR